MNASSSELTSSAAPPGAVARTATRSIGGTRCQVRAPDASEVAGTELDRAAEAAAIEPLVMLDAGYDLHTVDVEALQVLDLRKEAALRHVGLAPEDVIDEDRTACQAVGHAAWFLEMQGVVAPSASGVGLVITAFETRVPVGALALIDSVPFTRGNYVPAGA